MICNYCGCNAENGARICPRCGASLHPEGGKGGVSSIRQGRNNRTVLPLYDNQAQDEERANAFEGDAGRPLNRRGVRNESKDSGEKRPLARKEDVPRKVAQRSINSALLCTVLLGLVVAILLTFVVLAIKLPQGHMILMQLTAGKEEGQEKVISLIGEENAAVTLWRIGQQQLDEGYVGKAIESFLRAYELNPKIENLYAHLLDLADAYEATGQLNEAERVYTNLFKQVDENNPLAYRYCISLMLDQERMFEATALMQTAYEKTGEISFKSQREQLVPLAPVVSEVSGRYQLSQRVEISSPQGYDIYYLLNDEISELPEKGILYTEPLDMVDEGVHTLRAVCVSSALVSDEINLKYTIYYPTPSAPKSRKLTGVYDNAQRIYLYIEEIRDGKVVNSPNQDLTIYYTIDGTAPNSDSPVYTDEGFVLRAGKYTVRAVAVNQYGKVSNEYNGTYQINQSYKRFFRDTDDQFKAFTLGQTTYSAFQKQYGAGKEETVPSDTIQSGTLLRVSYDWGDAYFTPFEQRLYAISTNYASMTGPRNTKVGQKVADVIAQFRDVGQVANAKGNRSLYYDEATGSGYYWNDGGTDGRIIYTYHREDGGTTTLTYTIRDGLVTRITMAIENTALD